MIANTESFVDHVAGHAGVSNEQAERATQVVLSGFGAYVSPPQRGLVADELPPPLDATFQSGHDQALAIEDRVVKLGMSTSHAHELITSVCCVLAEELSREAIETLRAALPHHIGRLLALEPEALAPPPEPRHATLATGRPGSTHPLSEARPSRVQSDSVVASKGHEDTKLSSARGITQEREHETLAEARPGSDRVLAGSRRRVPRS